MISVYSCCVLESEGNMFSIQFDSHMLVLFAIQFDSHIVQVHFK